MLVFTPGIELLLIIILARMLYKIGSFRVVSFRLKLREVTPSSIRQNNIFSNTATRRMQLIYIERIAARYECKVFKATLPIYRELLPYVLCATHSIRLGSWTKYSITALAAQKNSHNFIPKAYILQVLGLILYYKRFKTK